MGETKGLGSDCTPETARGRKKSLGDDQRVGRNSVGRILRGGGAAFPSSTQYSRIIQVEVPESIISSSSLKRKRADRPVSVDGAGRVLDLVVDALGQLCGHAYALPN